MQVAQRVPFVFAQLNYCRRLALRYQKSLSQSSAVTRCQSLSLSTSTDVVPPPPSEGALKQYSPKIEQLVGDISKLTLLEVADLNELLKMTLNIKDAPMMAMGAMPLGGPKEEEEEVEVKREKTSFTVKLTQFDAAKKVQLIKEIKKVVEGLNLVQAKKFVESAPQVVRADIPKEEAEKLKEALTLVGAQVEIE